MHRLTLTHPTGIDKHGVLPAGEWLLHDKNAFEIANGMRPVGTTKLSEFEMRGQTLPTGTEAPILVMRSGAIGDLLFLGPALRQLKWDSGRKIALCTWKENFPMFDGCDFVDELVPYPLAMADAWRFREIKDMFNVLERSKEHATDAFAAELGVKVSDYRPFYRVTDAEKDAAKKHVFAGRPTLVIQQLASGPSRSYPVELWLEVIVKLERAGWGIVLLGLPGQLPPFPSQFATPFIRDLSRPGMTFREAAAVLSLATAFVGVDSAFLHLCHALDIPAVGLFASIPWQMRTIHAPKTTALSGVGPCAPCYYHSHGGPAFPPNKPCKAAKRCVVLADIEPARIIAKVNLLKP